MRRIGMWARRASSVLVLSALLALPVGCGGEPPASNTSSAGGSADQEREVAGVEVTVSGGLRGVRETHTVTAADPPAGLSPAEVDRVLELASSDVVLEYAGNHVQRGECCDLMQYHVTITGADGETTRIITNDLDDDPAAYDTLIRLVTQAR